MGLGDGGKEEATNTTSLVMKGRRDEGRKGGGSEVDSEWLKEVLNWEGFLLLLLLFCFGSLWLFPVVSCCYFLLGEHDYCGFLHVTPHTHT